MNMVDTVRTTNGINMFLSVRICSYHHLCLDPVGVEKISCPYGPSNLTV